MKGMGHKSQLVLGVEGGEKRKLRGREGGGDKTQKEKGGERSENESVGEAK
jgi:hypothetical protein